MNTLTVALLSGGISPERDVSLKGGDQVYDALDKNKYRVIRYDPKYDIDRLIADAPEISIALIIMHGPYGEDGKIQGLLDLLHIPYQGSGVLGSSLAMNKLASKQLYEKAGLPVPPYLVFNQNDPIDPDICIQKLGMPLVVKPLEGGSSIGMSIVKSKKEFKDAVDKAFSYDDTVMFETFIDGVELTGAVIGNDDATALPIVEIIPDKNHDFFDYEAKYEAGITQEICPARINAELTAKAQLYSKTAHRALFCKGYSRTDMILNNDRIYVLETNTIPGMTPTSLLPQAAEAAGISFSELLDKLIELGLEDSKNQNK